MDPVLTSPSLTLTGDSNEVVTYRRDADNYITQLFAEQLPAIQTGFFNVRMNKGIIIQPHWHTNVNELVFVIGGEVATTVFNPFTQKLMSYRLKPGQASMFPKGWFHWIVGLEDDTHILTVFDRPTPDIVYGSDFLRMTPGQIMQLAYSVDEKEYEKAVEPIRQSVILGPPAGFAPSMDDRLAQAAAPSPETAPEPPAPFYPQGYYANYPGYPGYASFANYAAAQPAPYYPYPYPYPY
ncbi:cupin domain-containing protein [Cohnella algarum]|uniref:cupin domain-containing protein n=2 Tax=Cohnella TaxID=329857 RepID=UPI003084286F